MVTDGCPAQKSDEQLRRLENTKRRVASKATASGAIHAAYQHRIPGRTDAAAAVQGAAISARRQTRQQLWLLP